MQDEKKSTDTQTEAAGGPISRAEIEVTVTPEALFDFYLYHAYSRLSGFLTIILGLAVFFLGVFSFASGKISAGGCAVFVLASICFIGYTPLQLKRKAGKDISSGVVSVAPSRMTFEDISGITLRRSDEELFYAWETVRRAAVTPKTISLYVGEEQALIIPKQDFGEQFALRYQIIARNLGRVKSGSGTAPTVSDSGRNGL